MMDQTTEGRLCNEREKGNGLVSSPKCCCTGGEEDDFHTKTRLQLRPAQVRTASPATGKGTTIFSLKQQGQGQGQGSRQLQQGKELQKLTVAVRSVRRVPFVLHPPGTTVSEPLTLEVETGTDMDWGHLGIARTSVLRKWLQEQKVRRRVWGGYTEV